MAAYENVFHAFMLKAFQQLEQRTGGRVKALGCSSAPVQAARGLDPARLVEPLERGVGASRNAVRARDLCLREHPVQAPAAMPSLDGVEYELGAILPADGSCHGGIIARSQTPRHKERRYVPAYRRAGPISTHACPPQELPAVADSQFQSTASWRPDL